MTGTESQIEWAERITLTVQAEFDRVAHAFRRAAERQGGQDRMDTLAIIAILEEKRAETLANEHAGYFVKAWQELSDQVRQLLARDSRYQAIQAERRARRAGHTFSIAVEYTDSCAWIRLGGRIVLGAATLALSEAQCNCLLPPDTNWVIVDFARVSRAE